LGILVAEVSGSRMLFPLPSEQCQSTEGYSGIKFSNGKFMIRDMASCHSSSGSQNNICSA